MDDLTRLFMPLAEKMAGLTELGDMRERVIEVLHEHRAQRWKDAPVHKVCLSTEHGPHDPRMMAPLEWPCSTFTLAACQLRILEVFDGTRFSDTWPGPVEERGW